MPSAEHEARWTIKPGSGRFCAVQVVLWSIQVVEKFRGRIDCRDQKAASRWCASQVEKLTFGFLNIVKLDFIGDRFDP
jgi:hypothetical protein